MKQTPIEKMDVALEKILTEYGDEINSDLQAAVKKAAQKGRAALKSSSPRSSGAATWGSAHYADNWAVKDTTTRLTVSDIIYNKKPTYRLAHLLEYGHAKVGGGRVPAQVHIKPIEEELKSFVLRAIESKV